MRDSGWSRSLSDASCLGWRCSPEWVARRDREPQRPAHLRCAHPDHREPPHTGKARVSALTKRARPTMLTDTSTWSHAPGNEVVPSRWQATGWKRVRCGGFAALAAAIFVVECCGSGPAQQGSAAARLRSCGRPFDIMGAGGILSLTAWTGFAPNPYSRMCVGRRSERSGSQARQALIRDAGAVERRVEARSPLPEIR